MGNLGINWNNIGNNAIGTAINTVTGGLAGNIMGMIGGLFGGSGDDESAAAQKRAFEYNKQLMAIQQGYNLENAERSHQYALDMWDKTNYEAQIKHMKAAGLNPALMYGGGGQGGTTVGAGKVDQVQQATAGASIVQMGLQAKLAEAEIRKTNAEAAKIMSETTAITPEIEATQAGTAKTIEETNLAKSAQMVNDSIISLNAANEKEVGVRMQEAETRMAKNIADVEKVLISNEIAEATKEATIQKAFTDYENAILTGLEKAANIKFTEIQGDYVREQTRTYFYNAVTERMKAEAAKQNAKTNEERLAIDRKRNEIEVWNANTYRKQVLGTIKYQKDTIDIEQEKLTQGWVNTVFNCIGQLSDAAVNFTKIGALIKKIRGGKETPQMPAEEPAPAPKSELPQDQMTGAPAKEYWEKVKRAAEEGEEWAIKERERLLRMK